MSNWKNKRFNARQILHASELNEILDGMKELSTEIDKNNLSSLKFVIPEQYGAVGDGIADDTEALAQALNSGYSVYLPIGSKYNITHTITISDSSMSKSKSIFSLGQNNYNLHSSIVCNFVEDTPGPIFDIQTDGLSFNNINFNAINNINSSEQKNLTLFKIKVKKDNDSNTYSADSDIQFNNCNFYQAKLFFDFYGRGLTVVNCCFASGIQLAHISWDVTDKSINLDSNAYFGMNYGSRAIRFENNRFHSMGHTTQPLIEVFGNDCYGFKFINNIIDKGSQPLISSDEQTTARNWLISNNTFHGARSTDVDGGFIDIKGKIQQFTFSNNNFNHPENDTKSSLVSIISMQGDKCQDLLITGNNIDSLNNKASLLILKNAITSCSNCSITNNIIQEVKNISSITNSGLIRLEHELNLQNLLITNNIINVSNFDKYAFLYYNISAGIVLSNIKILDNISPNNISILSDLNNQQDLTEIYNVITFENLISNTNNNNNNNELVTLSKMNESIEFIRQELLYPFDSTPDENGETTISFENLAGFGYISSDRTEIVITFPINKVLPNSIQSLSFNSGTIRIRSVGTTGGGYIESDSDGTAIDISSLSTNSVSFYKVTDGIQCNLKFMEELTNMTNDCKIENNAPVFAICPNLKLNCTTNILTAVVTG